MIAVELRPHKGIQRTALGPVEVEHDQYMIFAQGGDGPLCHVGYVGKQPLAPVNFLRQPSGQPWPEPIKQAVREAIATQLGAGERRECQPPELQPEEDEADDFDDDDSDD